jgi:hypothetical protein
VTAMRVTIFVIACGASLSHAFADEPKAPPADPESVVIHAYGIANPSCLEWSDGCTTCSKSGATEPACSTPGIACQPGSIQCKKNGL